MKITRYFVLSTAVGLIALPFLIPIRFAQGESPCRGPSPFKHFLRHCSRRPSPWDMDFHNEQAMVAVSQIVDAQARNGDAMDRTVWNFHFAHDEGDRPSAMLHPSGITLLHRLARRSATQGEFVILVETTHDLEFTSDEIDQFARSVDNLDIQRVRAVREYVAQVLRRPDARVLLHNPPRVGMPADEATGIYRKLIDSAKGALDPAMEAPLGEGLSAPLPVDPSRAQMPEYRAGTGGSAIDTGGSPFIDPAPDIAPAMPGDDSIP